MTINTSIEKKNVTSGVIKRLIQIVLGGVILAVFMFVPAGRLDWWQAWVYVAIYFGMVIFNALFILGKDPELIAERGETKENTKGWDKTVTNFITIVTLLTLIVAGLDARFGWSQVALPISIAGLIVVVLGYGIVSWAMAANQVLCARRANSTRSRSCSLFFGTVPIRAASGLRRNVRVFVRDAIRARLVVGDSPRAVHRGRLRRPHRARRSDAARGTAGLCGVRRACGIGWCRGFGRKSARNAES